MDDPAVLELQHETQSQRQVTFRGQVVIRKAVNRIRGLHGLVHTTRRRHTVLRPTSSSLKPTKVGSTDTCLGQFNGIHEGSACLYVGRTSEDKTLSSTYGAASDSLTFRFCRIDNEVNWSQKASNGVGEGGTRAGYTYSLFSSSIRDSGNCHHHPSRTSRPERRSSRPLATQSVSASSSILSVR